MIHVLQAQLSAAMSRRIRAMFGTITLVTLILSNLVFLIGLEPVWFYTKKVFYYGEFSMIITTIR